MSAEEAFITKEFCFAQHTKLAEDFHGLDSKLTKVATETEALKTTLNKTLDGIDKSLTILDKSLSTLDKSLSERMIKLETKFNDELEDKVSAMRSRQNYITVFVSVAAAFLFNVLLKILLP